MIKYKTYHLKMRAVLFIILSIATISTSFAQTGQTLSEDWINRNTFRIDETKKDFSDLMFLKNEIGDKRIVTLGEATHGDGATFEARGRLIEFLMEEMGFEVILFEAGMFDLQVANQYFKQTQRSDSLRKALWFFWKSKEWNPLYNYLQKRVIENKAIEVAGFDCKHSSSYGFKGNQYSNAIKEVFQTKKPAILEDSVFKEYISIWKSIEEGTENGILGRLRYKMTAKEKARFRELSHWVAEQFAKVGENRWAQTVRGMDQGILAYSDVRILKLIFNKKSFLTVNNLRDSIMAENLSYLLQNEYSNKKVIILGATYHFIRNNHKIDPIAEHGIKINESTIMGNLIYPQFKNEIYSVGFTAYEGEFGNVKIGKKGNKVISPSENSLEFQLVKKGYQTAFVSLKNVGQDPFWGLKPSLRLFSHKSDSKSNYWNEIIDGVYFIKTMKPSTY